MSGDADVLSVPVGRTFHLVERFLVHACPDTYPYRDTPYTAFRPEGGEMKAVFPVFPIEKIYRLSPPFSLPEDVAPEHRERLREYIDARLAEQDFTDQPYRFYMLSREHAKQLPHLPAPARNHQGHCYFTLEELTRGNKVVSLASEGAI